MAELGLSPWSGVRLAGRRTTGALVATAAAAAPDEVHCDDLTLGNLGLVDGASVTLTAHPLEPATSVQVTGPAEVVNVVPSAMVRAALVGKMLTAGDNVSLLPQDVAPTAAADVAATRRALSAALGMGWTTALLTVVRTNPVGPRLVTADTVVNGDAAAGGSVYRAPRSRIDQARDDHPAPPPPALSDLDWLAAEAEQLRGWLDLSFHHGTLLAKLGSAAPLGVLVAGPDGAGKATLVRAVAAAVGASVVRRTPADLSGLGTTGAAEVLHAAVDEALGQAPAVLLLEDVETLAPATGGPGAPAAPLAPVLAEVVERAAGTEGIALVCTAAGRDAVDPRLRRPGLLDKEIGVPLPDRADRAALLAVLLRGVPLGPDVDLAEVAARTPGFVAADLLRLRREAAGRAAQRQRDAETAAIGQADLLGALSTVDASAAGQSTVDTPELSLDDVGDMVETKQALTETVLWPLAHPDSFARLGIQPPRGVLLYGPPGCGKTFLVRALAGTGQLNVLVVKGAELMSMWVGESERGVRELFRRARDAAPALVFLDEIDALAPPRGQSTDSGVTDRVVAALLTELDGVEQLRDVVVIGATNRPDLVDPALLRPGRLERMVYVPPPDADARAAILRAAAKSTPLAADIDLAAVGARTEGYSAADCAALLREAALAAMRRSFDAPEVTAADLAAAQQRVRPSLRPEQVAALAAFAEAHRGR
jgi:transitional endoplasmic reticulum ATPase